jgi:hypothetical protein
MAHSDWRHIQCKSSLFQEQVLQVRKPLFQEWLQEYLLYLEFQECHRGPLKVQILWSVTTGCREAYYYIWQCRQQTLGYWKRP